ncbi:hypothetical protein [Hydrogenophaga sp.]|uniref:hypothetical protein n=1 Tax=Hydrogenophaga sp. TaxID=1904254 RepID=UPI002721C899|nr:hypothetical protein [Hydrogenophaga sp.]MDO9135098.1 hypothetical protein [Hydrogenophaga sp.]MDO9604120.1 hypothetical protein [Hydrogenophaga sp.]MDP3476659.1 hypothetical protein [Hydrogenophaga sp.]
MLWKPLACAIRVLGLDAFLADQIGHAHAQQAAELFEPAAVEHVLVGRGGGDVVFVLRVLAPDDQRHLELHRRAHREGEEADVRGPRNVAHLGEAPAVELGAHQRVGRDLDGVHAQALEVFDVGAGQRREIAGGRGDAQRVQAQLQHAHHLVGAVLVARIPVHPGAFLVAAAGVAHAVVVQVQVRLGVWHHAGFEAGQHVRVYRKAISVFPSGTR